MLKVRAVFGIVLFAMFLTGCGDTTPNNLTVIQHNLTIKTWKSNDARLVQSLYHHILSLPKKKPGGICPQQTTQSYLELFFAHDQQQVLYVTDDDCNGVVLEHDDPRVSDAEFGALLQKVTQNAPVSCTPYPPTPIYPGDKGGCP